MQVSERAVKSKAQTFRLSEADHKALGVLAAREHRNFSQMIRECIRREASRQGLWRESDEPAT